MEYPLEKYRRFIKDVEKSPLFDNLKIGFQRLSGARINGRVKETSSNVIAEITKNGKAFSIRYIYEGFNKIYLFDAKNLTAILFRVRRISSRNLLTHKILEEVIKYQRRYLETGDPIDLVPLSQIQLPLDNSWTSRLVSRLSVITPSGEEKPLKWFFPTQRDINKRLIKQLLDKENEDLQSGRLRKPCTDNEIRTRLEALLRACHSRKSGNPVQIVSVSRHSVCHCRKDMGIPPASMRLSGYKYPPLSVNFSMPYPLTIESVTKHAPEQSGVYEFSIKRDTRYEQRDTVFYIGSTRSLRKRLREHLGKNSKNGRIRDFLKKHGCFFRYILFSKSWELEEKRLYDLFKSTYGASPKCNKVSPVGVRKENV